VLGEGQIQEFGAPATLLENPNGAFSQLVDNTGPEASRFLREAAIKAAAAITV
jgi:hypothetical protein